MPLLDMRKMPCWQRLHLIASLGLPPFTPLQAQAPHKRNTEDDRTLWLCRGEGLVAPAATRAGDGGNGVAGLS